MPEHVCYFGFLGQGGPCDGALIRAHLIPKQLLKREFPQGVAWAAELDGETVTPPRWRAYDPRLAYFSMGDGTHPFVVVPAESQLKIRTLDEITWDRRAWVPMCGGPTGIGGHHGKFDGKQLRLARADVPLETETFAEELGLGWWLCKEYGCGHECSHPGRVDVRAGGSGR